LNQKLNLVLITCPICNLKKKIEIPYDAIQSAKSLAAIFIPKNLICEHNFQAFIDKNYAVRGYQKIDFELPSSISENKIEKQILLESDLNDIEIVKWNLSPENLIHVIHGILYDRNFIFIIPDSKENILESIEKFIELVFRDTFKFKLSIIKESDYKKLKKDFKHTDVIGWKNVLNDKDKIFEKNRLEVEKKIVRNFLNNSSKQDALIDLEYEIRKIFIISKNIIDISKSLKTGESVDKLSLINKLKEDYSIEVEIQYLEYIIEVIQYYFKIIISVEEYEKLSQFLKLI